MEERYKAAVVLTGCNCLVKFNLLGEGVGDAMGFNNGRWEFCNLGSVIHEEMELIGGIKNLSLAGWRISDDQVMHLHTARALIRSCEFMHNTHDTSSWIAKLISILAEEYVLSFEDMEGRAPGQTTKTAISLLKGNKPIPFNAKGGGCGGAMRAMCIGLRFVGEKERDSLIAVALESARLTHNHPTAMFGSLVSALFTSYAIEGVPVVEWGRKMISSVLQRAYKYLEMNKTHWNDYQKDLRFFEEQWRSYLKLRGIAEDGQNIPKFPKSYGVQERDNFYNKLSFQGWGGASGHDCVIIAYDALLGAGDSWEELTYRGILHGGDSDSTGAICAAWFGAVHGFKGVPKCNYSDLEYLDVALEVGEKLFKIHQGEKVDSKLLPTKSHSSNTAETILHVISKELKQLEDQYEFIKKSIGEIKQTEDFDKKMQLQVFGRYCSFRSQDWKNKFVQVDSLQISEDNSALDDAKILVMCRIQVLLDKMDLDSKLLTQIGIRTTSY